VDSYRIDDWVQGKTLVKIDVEGAELRVLESDRKVFQEGGIDVVVVEVQHETVDSVVRWLWGQGFDCFANGKRLPMKVGDSLPQMCSSFGSGVNACGTGCLRDRAV